MKGKYFYPAQRNQLQLDIDTKTAEKTFKKNLIALRRNNLISIKKIVKHKSRGGNKHITIFLKEILPSMEQIFLQAILGSDLKRELCNYGRVKNGCAFPILFITNRKRRN